LENSLTRRKKIKIVLVVFSFPPNWIGGTEIATYNIARHLSNKGHDVHVITSIDKGMPEISSEYGFKVHRLSYYKKNKIIKVIQFWYKIFLNMHTIKPDIVHIQGVGNGVPAVLTKLLFKVPYVVCGHGDDVYSSWSFKKPISKIVFSNADAVIALTSHMKKEMQKLCLRHVHVIPNGIDVKKFNINKDEKISMNTKTILFVGRLNKIKGVEYLIQAVSIIRNNYNVKLIIIGDGEEKNVLKELADNLNLSDCICFTGLIDNDKIPEHMTQVDIFVLPSLSEGLPVVILEAMASGLPIVATNVGGLPDILEDGVNGFLVEPGNPEQLAEKIALLLMDNILRKKMSETNRKETKKYDWCYVVEQFEEVYFSVCKNS
jgi:glycosyltransferase involved in cell wall biosynthesis